MSQQQIAVQRSPLSLAFLFHIVLELPVAVQGTFSPLSLPFLDMNNTSVVILKLYAMMLLASCIASFLCYSLPDFLPGKRAFVIMLVIYHTVSSTILYQAPRFIPHSFGAAFEGVKVIPETVWGTLHGLIGLLFVFWWQQTIPVTRAVGGR
ncbi:hypothetical protein BKA62DRAFT_708857 [Auriculariales sp. MPI-PUGE-AT-0066]|nr:hypothetical protein BKA62DRAFT_708857 [Auriculariales sp. MPI-PUGE-AT-0066]